MADPVKHSDEAVAEVERLTEALMGAALRSAWRRDISPVWMMVSVIQVAANNIDGLTGEAGAGQDILDLARRQRLEIDRLGVPQSNDSLKHRVSMRLRDTIGVMTEKAEARGMADPLAIEKGPLWLSDVFEAVEAVIPADEDFASITRDPSGEVMISTYRDDGQLQDELLHLALVALAARKAFEGAPPEGNA